MPLTLVLVVLGRHIPAFGIFDILLDDRPALTAAETFYQRALAGHPEEAIEQAEDLLETRTLASYYDEVVLGGLRLAAADVDRGALERSALRAVCGTVLEVLDALDSYQDSDDGRPNLAPVDPAPAPVNASHDCDDLFGRKIVCVPGPGPLDPAVAAMATQLFRRAGCEVDAISRDALRRSHHVGPEQQIADAVCVVGLFDERSFRRIQPVIQQAGLARVLVGVQRANIGATDVGPQELLPSLSVICAALKAAVAPEKSEVPGKTGKAQHAFEEGGAGNC